MVQLRRITKTFQMGDVTVRALCGINLEIPPGQLLASIAGISLLVGGIGIMNIMLVSGTDPRNWHPAGHRSHGHRRATAVSA